ncbi:ABC transporter permease [Paenibacillus sp. FSL H8-0034]|uniref:ABC transporter permease n=1 Tax=Paenibacillus sp. FSL H8-0034 TaxID=2954671 RepID=UPI004046E8B3
MMITKKLWRRNVALYMMFLPVLLFFLVFKYAPMFGFIIAFKDYNFMGGILNSPWVGLKHFNAIFHNPQTLRIIKNTVVLSLLNVVVGFPFPIILALLLNEARKMWFKRVVQTLVYLPHFFSWVIVGGIVLTVFSQQNGVVNHFVQQITGAPFPFLYVEGSWIAIFVSSGIWKEAGFSAIIYLAALTSIDPSLYEAAKLDGAGKWKQIVHVTIPGISSTIMILFILAMGRVMEVGFDQVYMLQNSTVTSVSEVISTYMYKVGLMGAQFSLSTALGLFESMVGLLLILSVNGIARKYDKGLW